MNKLKNKRSKKRKNRKTKTNNQKIVLCCKLNESTEKKLKKCRRKDGNIFDLPRRFSKKKCSKPKGFTMKASCAPYKNC